LFGAIIKLSEPSSKANRTNFLESSPFTTTDGYLPEYDIPEMLKNKQPNFVVIETTKVPELEKAFTKAEEKISKDIATATKKTLLTEILPDPGYFAAG